MVFLVLKAMQAIKTGLVKRQLSLGSAVSLSLLFGHCLMGMGTARESGFFVLLGFSSGSFCKGLLGTAARVKWSNQNGSWLAASPADGRAGAAGGAGVCLEHGYRGQEPCVGQPSV